MRRLAVLPCPEPFDLAASDGDGRFCERCQLRVTEIAQLDTEQLDSLIATASSGQRVCGRFELHGDRLRTRLGLALGLYKFVDLLADDYTVQVFYGRQNQSVIARLGEQGRFRAHFQLGPETYDGMLMMVVEARDPIDMTSASSSYSSRMLEYD